MATTRYYLRTSEGKSLKRPDGTLIPFSVHTGEDLHWNTIYILSGWDSDTVLLAEESSGDHLIVHDPRDGGVDSVMIHCPECHDEGWISTSDGLCDMCAEMAEACSKPLPE